jgi:hypothetical protein
MATSIPKVSRDPLDRLRIIGAWVSLVVFCLALVGSLLALWAQSQVLDTDTYVETVTPLAADPAIQKAVADRITLLLTEQIQRDDVTRNSLAVVAGGGAITVVNDFVGRIVTNIIDSDAFQDVWVSANEIAHRQAIEALTGDERDTIFLQDGQLVLDLNPLIARVKGELQTAGVDVADRIQIDPANATFVLFVSTDIRDAQEAIKQLETLAIVLPIITISALAVCLLIARDRSRMLTWVGLGTALTMVGALVVFSVARDRYLEDLGTGRNSGALAAAFDIVFRSLRDAVRWTVIVGLSLSGLAAMASSNVLRQARVVTAVARYRYGLIGSTIAIACLVIVAADELSFALATVVTLLSVASVLTVFWLAQRATTVAGMESNPGITT